MSELRERILNANDIASEKLFIEAWGVEVEVRGMSGRARAEVMQEALKGGTLNLAVAYPLLVIGCTYDPATGERVFSDADFEAVADKAGGALEQIAVTAARLSGLDAEAVERSKSATP